jgi:hypothetical protein
MATQPNQDSTPIWLRSSVSGSTGQCVEVANSGSSVLVRDSGDRSGAVLAFTYAQWRGLLRRIRNGEGAPPR